MKSEMCVSELFAQLDNILLTLVIAINFTPKLK